MSEISPEISAYLERRLPSVRAEGLTAAQNAINKVASIAIGHGALHGSRVWFQYEEVIEREFVKALNKAAGLIAEIAGSAAPDYADALERLSSELTDDLIRSRAQRREAASAFNETAYVDAHVERVRSALAAASANIVGDFRFGVVGGKQMAKESAVQNAVTIQNVSDSIINVVQTGHLSGKYQELGLQLAQVIRSPEVQGLPVPDKEEVTDLATHVKDELAARAPDEGRLRRALTRLSKGLASFGANTASGTISKLIADYVTSGGSPA